MWGALAPASSGLKDPVPGALSPHAPRCGARTGFPTGAREKPPPQIACGRRSRLSSKVHTSRHEKRRYRAYVEVFWVGLPARYLRGGKIRGRGLQKSRWRVRFGCIVATHPDGQDCDILRYCALFSILNGALRLAMAHRPPDLVALFRAVSKTHVGVVWFGRTAVPSRCVSWLLSLLHCPGHTQQEIADAVGISQPSVVERLKTLSDLDKCPKPIKIAFISSISRPIFSPV